MKYLLTILVIMLIYAGCMSSCKSQSYTPYGINDEDSLIADETYIVNDTLGFTMNPFIADIIHGQDGCAIVCIDSVDEDLIYHWFVYKKAFHICISPYHDGCDAECECKGSKCHKFIHECIDVTHETCDGECECDGFDCNK